MPVQAICVDGSLYELEMDDEGMAIAKGGDPQCEGCGESLRESGLRLVAPDVYSKCCGQRYEVTCYDCGEAPQTCKCDEKCDYECATFADADSRCVDCNGNK